MEVPETCDEAHPQNIVEASIRSVADSESQNSDTEQVILSVPSISKKKMSLRRNFTKQQVIGSQQEFTPFNLKKISEPEEMQLDTLINHVNSHKTFGDLFKEVDFDNPDQKRLIGSLLKQALMENILREMSGNEKDHLHKLLHLT